MKPNDYITLHTAMSLGQLGYERFRSYLQFIGYEVNPHGARWVNLIPFFVDIDQWAIVLHSNGNLGVAYLDLMQGNELHLEDVTRITELMP